MWLEIRDGISNFKGCNRKIDMETTLSQEIIYIDLFTSNICHKIVIKRFKRRISGTRELQAFFLGSTFDRAFGVFRSHSSAEGSFRI